MSSWTQSSVSLSKLHEIQKPLNDKSVLGFNVGEISSGETSTQSNSVYDKFKKMNFVKASVIHNTYESVKYDEQTYGQLNKKGKEGIGYIRSENSKTSWLKNRIDKEKVGTGSKSSVPHQPRRGPKKVKSVWRKIIYLSGVLSFYLLSEMASSLIVKALQVNFDSVLGIPDNDGMVKMFRVLESTGLRGFLGYPSVLYEKELEQFFDTALFLFSVWRAGQTSCKKRKLKYEFRLLNDILAKSVTVKVGSFDAVTHERCVLMTTIHFELKVNWSKLLFDILKEMADRSSKRSKGYAAQICALLKGDPAVTLEDAKTFPPLKILSAKTSTLVKVTVAPAGGIGISRFGDISVTHEDLLALVRIEVAAGRHRARDVSIAAGSDCVVLVAADQQARLCKSVKKRRRLFK
ncbi:hypothetical protein F511_29484 [Dorcoceras hygrometricum]|uniref:Uncharacterized protein n=1 Tax=Dorcoceras hygrometricum TaxID=472368 RepID=A0A2Z7AYA7_9LAMI|nr:hypothetical protein F511_29484 [Dorcoceras hygrometricum]